MTIIRMIIYIMFTFYLLTTKPTSGHDMETRWKVISSAQQHFRSECVHLIESRDFRMNVLIVSIQRRLSDDVIPSAVVNTASVIDNSHCLLTSCNRPVYTIFDDNDARATLKMLSDSNKLSERVWLLFLESSSSLDEYFLNINIPFDCEFIVAAPLDSDGRIGLTEVYRVAEHLSLQTFHLGFWSFEQGFQLSNTSFYDRRSNLNGNVFKTSVMEWAPLSIVKVNVLNNRTLLEGFEGKVWVLFEDQMNFKSVHVVPPGVSYGSLSDNGTWDGVMGAVLRKQVDMAGITLTMTPERFEYIAFSSSLYHQNVRMYIRQPSRDASFSSLMSPFSPPLWSAFILSALGVSASLAACFKDGLKDTAFSVFTAIFCQQGHNEPSRSSSKRIVIFVISLMGIVVISSYSCFLVSSLTNYIPHLPFTTLEGLLDDGRYSLGMLKTSWLLNEFKHANEHDQDVMKRVFDKHVAPDLDNTPATSTIAFQRVCDKRYVYIGSEFNNSLMDLNCGVVSFPNGFSKRNLGYAFLKGSPYIGLFNSNILKLKSSGILNKMSRDDSKKNLLPEKKSVYASFHTVIPILSFGASGILLSLMVLALEKLAYILGGK